MAFKKSTIKFSSSAEIEPIRLRFRLLFTHASCNVSALSALFALHFLLVRSSLMNRQSTWQRLSNIVVKSSSFSRNLFRRYPELLCRLSKVSRSLCSIRQADYECIYSFPLFTSANMNRYLPPSYDLHFSRWK